jgi:glycerol kinase
MIKGPVSQEKVVLSLDVGTTTVRSFLYNKRGKLILGAEKLKKV